MPTDSEWLTAPDAGGERWMDMTTTRFLYYALNAMLESTEGWEITLADFIKHHGWVLLPADLL